MQVQFIYNHESNDLLSVHRLNKRVDVFFAVSSISTFTEMVSLSVVSTFWRWEFEGPQERICFFKVRSTSVNFVDKIFNTDDTKSSQISFNDVICGDWNSLSVFLCISTFVNQFSNSFKIWETISYKRFNKT